MTIWVAGAVFGMTVWGGWRRVRNDSWRGPSRFYSVRLDIGEILTIYLTETEQLRLTMRLGGWYRWMVMEVMGAARYWRFYFTPGLVAAGYVQVCADR